jgi:hypothetical protein
MSTDPLDQLRSGKKVTSLRRRRMARDVIFDSRDELVYGGLYVTSRMAAVVSNNTRTTLDNRTSSLIHHYTCTWAVFELLQTILFCSFTLSRQL